MGALWIIVMMIIIGAAIGGFTNSLAIKMLFRPYKPIKLGRFQVPFTPGLIPKRRDELAVQLGQMVVNHLITKEGLQQKLNQSKFREDLVHWVQQEVGRNLDNDVTLNELASNILKNKQLDESVDDKLKIFLNDRITDSIAYYQDQSTQSVLSESLQNRIEAFIPESTTFIQKQLVDFVTSSEGKQQLKQLIDEFLAGRGMLGNMINMFLGNESLIDKVQSELVKLLKKETVAQMLDRVLRKEWEKVKAEPISKWIHLLKLEEAKSYAVDWAVERVDTKAIFSKPVHELVAPYQPYINETLIPDLTDRSLLWVGERIETLMEKLQLSELVQLQVETFAVERLEEMVLSISRRELKMITYLGALLGGIIGFIQGLLVYFLT